MNEIVPLGDIKEMAKAVGPLFNKKPDDMFALMLIAQAEGKHPAMAAQEYDIIQGRPVINSRSAQARFQLAGGKLAWKTRTDTEASATFSHAQGGELTISWTIERANKAGLTSKDNWRKFPAQMLSARVVAEGVRAVFPACLSGMYTQEEAQDYDWDEMKNVTPENANGYAEIQANLEACQSMEDLQNVFAESWKSLDGDNSGRELIRGTYQKKKGELS